MNSFELHNPTKILFGAGKVKQLAELIEPYGNRILFVYGEGSIKRTGLYDEVLVQLNGIEASVYELSGVEPNPKLSKVNEGIEICKQEKIDFILAVGGGSVIDTGKAIAAGALYNGNVWDFIEYRAVIRDALPVGAVLTLAATGSEMNSGAVITDWDRKLKRSMVSKWLFPKFSILDPKLTLTVSPEQTVNGIIDMMSHVFEQYFSKTTDTPLQERFAESLLLTIIENGEKVITDSKNYEARANLLLAGTYALNGTLSTGVVSDWSSHSIEHELSAYYDIAHGKGLAVIFPNWMKYVYLERVDRFVQYATRVWNIDPVGKSDEQIALEGIEATRTYFKRIGAPTTLRELGVGNEKFDLMTEAAVKFGPIGTFKKLNKADIRSILESSL
ncbi:iron-containing alcohol dehydrogenase [Paenibacillus sp. LMG 31461]|uniref:Iron-containing alcohol dehydrogenase n=1 Tax=Paenibacillus plantarum TaxID=2654975 RepID=A0ABX1X4C4_9BACL|nr:iron-containing alcohol dehydrogenase [Paenibacillus plantarum]NOU63258.1 iron-containing alcohol dehydrogenase [Paenibacillus plantarum]